MKISIKVKPNSRQPSVERLQDGTYVVRVKAPAKEGRANEAVVEAVSEYFGLPKRRVSISHGHSGKNKIVEIS